MLSALQGQEEMNSILCWEESHWPDMEKFEFLEKVGEMSKLPVVIMFANDNKNEMLGGLFKGAVFYLVKPITMNDIKNLWRFAFMNKTDATVAAEGLTSISRDQDAKNQIFPIKVRQNFRNAKRKDPKAMDKYEEEDNNDFNVCKKPKLIWTNNYMTESYKLSKCLALMHRSSSKENTSAYECPRPQERKYFKPFTEISSLLGRRSRCSRKNYKQRLC